MQYYTNGGILLMDFKKPFKVLTTAALIGSLAFSSIQISASATATSKSVEQKEVNNNELTDVILTKDSSKIKVSFLTYMDAVGNETALNGYQLSYIVSHEQKIYDFNTYVDYYVDKDLPEEVIEKLAKANKAETSVEGVKAGGFKNGKLTEIDTSENTLTTPKEIVETANTTTLSEAGTYGGTKEQPQEIEGNIIITNEKVNLSNVVIKGTLTIASSVNDGDVIIDNTTVAGNTYVKGGGLNSVHFQDSVIATVIVNKNNGKVRVVVTGNTHVEDVRLESYAKLEEENLATNADGFTDVRIDPTVQQANEGLEEAQFIGDFDTINSKAVRVKLNVPAGSTVQKIALDAIATVLGSGKISNAEINQNATGSIFEQSLDNVVLNNGAWIEANGQEITESTSSETTTQITQATVAPDSIGFSFSRYVAGITEEDFNIEATVDGQPVEVYNLEYRQDMQRLFFEPFLTRESNGKTLQLKVTPKGKLTGQPITTQTIELKEGFSGRITDVQEVGMANVNLSFKNDDLDEPITTTTDKYGYYYVDAPAGEYEGTISGNNVVTTNMYPYTTTNTFMTSQNETAIATAASSELKIVLNWGKLPYDVDSHLVGLDSVGNPFHIFYGDRVAYDEDEKSWIDLDWDDTNSYGPETTTFRQLKDGQYIFYLHNYSGNMNYDEDYNKVDSTLKNSQATIEVFKGDNKEADATIDFDKLEEGNVSDLYYYAYGIEISNNGNDVKILPIEKFDKAVNAYGTANLKAYLPSLIERADAYLVDENTAEFSEARAEIAQKLTAAKELNIATADFQSLIGATLGLKVAISNMAYLTGELYGEGGYDDGDNFYPNYDYEEEY